MDSPQYGNYAYYERLVLQIKQQVTQGILAPDEKLPSVRDMAKQVQLNPNTVAKAYKQLEQDGTLYVKPGKGSFIRPQPAQPTPAAVATLHQKFQGLLAEAKALGVEMRTIQSWVSEEED